MDQIEIFQISDNQIHIEENSYKGAVWLMHKQVGELLGTKHPANVEHCGNINSTGELGENSVSSNLEHAATDEKMDMDIFYNPGANEQ